jgi:RNA polymerase sporulation-specific sigma factor
LPKKGGNFVPSDFKERVIRAREEEGESAKIIKDFEPLIKKCIRMYIKDTESFEDAMQEGRLAIFGCINKYDITSPVYFEGYVKMAVIYCIRHFGSKYRENISLDKEINEDGVNLHEIIDSGIDIEGDKIKKDEINSLRTAVSRLPENEKKIIDEFYFEGKTMREMCKGRRCHYMTVVKHKEKALESLRRVIG